MGASLVKGAYEQYPHLPDHAMRALVYMAVTAKDNDETPTYWGGRDALASAIGHPVVDLGDGSTESGDAADAAYRAVGRAIESLTVAKAISRAGRAAPGRNASYQLNVSIERGTSGDTRSDETQDAPRPPSNGRRAVPSMERRTFRGSNTGRLTVRTQDALRPPEEEVGSKKEEDQKTLGPYASHGASPADVGTTDEFSVEQPPATAPPLRLVKGATPSQPVAATTAAKQPALWPAAVPDNREDTVNAAEARAEIRAALKGRSNAPITRAGREREAAARGTWRPAARGANAGALAPGEADTPPPITRHTPHEGHGFCVPCYDQGKVTLAADPVDGSTCDRHIPAQVAS